LNNRKRQGVYALVYIALKNWIVEKVVLESAWGEKHSLGPSMGTLFVCESDMKFVLKRP